MEDSFAKVMSLAAFIVLGHLLRRFNILKDQAFAAISALVMNVTLPCVILTNLNGVRIEGDMLLIAGLGLLTNIIFLVWGLFLSRNIADTQWRDFVRLNVGGYSVGPFAVPYVQSFFPTTGLMATCMFDVGNCVMAGGGTFAVIAGTRVKTTLWRTVKLVVSKLVRSGPLVTFAFVGLMSVLDMRLPDGVITEDCTRGSDDSTLWMNAVTKDGGVAGCFHYGSRGRAGLHTSSFDPEGEFTAIPALRLSVELLLSTNRRGNA